MRKVLLGMGLKKIALSEVCFGSLAISPLQGRVSSRQGQKILEYALDAGINWLDTAEIYDNYGQLRPVLRKYPEVRIVSKSYAVTGPELEQSLEKARKGLGREVIDIFLLHEQESFFTLKGHAAAWEALLAAKAKGRVSYIGISTHAVQGVRAGALQPGLDVIHPLINFQGLGIIDGTLEQMQEEISFASGLGIFLYAMKVFGGGHLGACPEKALGFVRETKGVKAMALGMSSRQEVDFNLAFLAGNPLSPELKNLVLQRERRLYVAGWCQGCGKCVEVCPQKALELRRGQAVPAEEKCILCGYCGRVCPHFCLKII